MNTQDTRIVVTGRDSSCDAVRRSLGDADFEYTIAGVSRRERLVDMLLGERRPDIIISELQLDDFSALDLTSILQRHGCQKLPVILLVETGVEAIALGCLENGIDQLVIRTPSSLRRLCTLVPYLVRRSKEQEQQALSTEKLEDRRDSYLDVFDNTNDLIQCLAQDGSFLYTNRAWRDAMGYSEDEVCHMRLTDVLHPDSMASCQEKFIRLKAGEILHGIDFKFVTKSGDTLHLKGDCGSIFKGGEAVSTRGIFKNITETVKAEKARKVSDARYQTLYENAPDIYSIVNAQGIFESINRAGAEKLGYTVDELVGKPVSMVIHPRDRERVGAYLAGQFKNPGDGTGIEYRKIRKDGSVLWAHQLTNRDPDTSQPRMLVLCRDITEQHNLRKRLSFQATHDDLTQLINRREFDRRLRRMLAASTVSDDHHALCYLDLDQFKVINDTCGHVAGDELLRQVAALLSREIRTRDTLARLGGDEFAILMEHCPLEQAEILTNRIRERIEDFRFQWNARRFSVGVSIGVVPIQRAGSVENVLSLADSACYQAKRTGRNRVHVLRPGDGAIAGKIGDSRWASRISEALDNNAFGLFVQEIASCSPDHTGTHMEVLLRLHDAGETIDPGAFMPVAERYNLSGKIDHWVLDRTMQWFEERPESLDKLGMCSINLSALSLCDESFREYALERVCSSGFPAEKLCFEVTETAAISNLVQATQFMNALRDKGCQFALDDFGSGLSSLAYLKDLPVDIVKIDGAFVRNIAISDVDRMMVKSICEIARLMNIKTTAEYVESEEALQVLREAGIDYVQGFHIGRPVPIGELAADRPRKADVLRFRR